LAKRARSPRRGGLGAKLHLALRAQGLEGRAIVVACSGGVDSVVLAHALHDLGVPVSLAHVHHGLRGESADADEAFVAELAKRLELPFAHRRVDPRARIEAAPSSRVRPTVQEAARRLRAEALRDAACELGADHVALAHNADDQAETVLLRLLRGTGPEGLGGIAECSPDGFFVRPMLGVARREILAHAGRQGIEWREDPSNADRRYARARLRHEWLPGLARDFNPRLLRAIGDLAEAQRRESEWISLRVEQEASRRFAQDATSGALRIGAQGWGVDVMPDAIARRLARHALHQMGAARDVTRAHLERVVRFWREGRLGRRLELPDGLVLVRDARGFSLGRNLPPGSGC
jgi:tRNA(Ile)-lysidine synthase